MSKTSLLSISECGKCGLELRKPEKDHGLCLFCMGEMDEEDEREGRKGTRLEKFLNTSV